MGKKLPADYAIDAFALEAERRGKALGRPYSYGKLVADTTKEEREEILRAYREGSGKKRGGRRSAFLEKDKDAEEEAVRKLREAADTEP